MGGCEIPLTDPSAVPLASNTPTLTTTPGDRAAVRRPGSRWPGSGVCGGSYGGVPAGAGTHGCIPLLLTNNGFDKRWRVGGRGAGGGVAGWASRWAGLLGLY